MHKVDLINASLSWRFYYHFTTVILVPFYYKRIWLGSNISIILVRSTFLSSRWGETVSGSRANPNSDTLTVAFIFSRDLRYCLFGGLIERRCVTENPRLRMSQSLANSQTRRIRSSLFEVYVTINQVTSSNRSRHDVVRTISGRCARVRAENAVEPRDFNNSREERLRLAKWRFSI